MRTEYVTPLMGKYESQINHIEEQLASATPAEKTKLSKVQKDYQAKLNELREFDSKLKHYADMRIQLDLDDGVKVNYGKFGNLLANVKDITGE
jgi:type II restriction/modification system DNA methylase subunit YeeA